VRRVESRPLREVIESTSRRSMPGILELISLYCGLKLKLDYFTVLVNNPEYIVEVLVKLYNPEIAELIVYEIFTKPIVEVAGRGDPRELAKLAVRDPRLFREEVKKLLEIIEATTRS
jgi:hypothetical protein